ncbi:MAG: type VI secretion system tip protein TssI/VgrG [Myxococcota bacterium]
MAQGYFIDDLEFQCEGPAAEAGLRLLDLRGGDQLNAPYAYELLVQTEQDGGLDEATLVDLTRRRVSFWFGREGGMDTIHGVVQAIELRPPMASSPVSYTITVVPELQRLALGRRSRVFHSMSYPAIVRRVLRDVGWTEDTEFEFRLSRSARSPADPSILPDPGQGDDDFVDYPAREYTVQYEESDLQFIQRLLEHEGIHYRFVQGDEREKLVFGDDNAHFEETVDISYQPNFDGSDTPVVRRLSQKRVLRPARVDLRDYNWRTPSVSPEGTSDVDTQGYGFVAGYGEHFRDPAEGQRYAVLRAEELTAEQVRYQGTSTHTGIRPGARVRLEGCPLPDLDQEYVVVAVEQSVRLEEDGVRPFEMSFVAQAFDVPFRPPRVTPRPRIDGVMHARIDGEVAGMVAPIDDDGRYRVRLPYDSGTYVQGRASRWIRMAQPTAGQGYGMHFPLHVGVEVMLSHVGGDPDRPVIVGSIPNRETVTPVTRENATQSQVRTRSGILMEFEDDA